MPTFNSTRNLDQAISLISNGTATKGFCVKLGLLNTFTQTQITLNDIDAFAQAIDTGNAPEELYMDFCYADIDSPLACALAQVIQSGNAPKA